MCDVLNNVPVAGLIAFLIIALVVNIILYIDYKSRFEDLERIYNSHMKRHENKYDKK